MKHIKFFRLCVLVIVVALLAAALGGAVPASCRSARVIVRGTSLEIASAAVVSQWRPVYGQDRHHQCGGGRCSAGEPGTVARTVGVLGVMPDRSVKMVGDSFQPRRRSR